MSGSMDKSHATGDSIVPDKVQQKAPAGLEDKLPDSVHDTSTGGHASAGKGDSTSKSHATDPDASIVPKKIQEKVPKGLEEALPDAIHPTKK